MSGRDDILDAVRQAASQRILFLPHAVRQMSRPDRMIGASDVRCVIEQGQVIEDYPSDPRGHSCLLLGQPLDGRPIHVVCSPKKGYLAVITAYRPDATQWEDDLKTRKPL
ncbi:DUF4258 domain-containing protein [bacterium]|nr:DUF4258 domain-containing protein [bacterium]